MIHAAGNDHHRSRPVTSQQPKSNKFKPNSLPVLNCLFAALGRNNNKNNFVDETPYADVPEMFTRINNNIVII
jgi:hypothetical protein